MRPRRRQGGTLFSVLLLGHHVDGVDVQALRDSADVAAREVDEQGNPARADGLNDEAIASLKECRGDARNAANRIVLKRIHARLVLHEARSYTVEKHGKPL